MSRLLSTLAIIFRLARPYFFSEDRWAGRVLLAAVIDARAPSGPLLLTLAACAGRYQGGETIWNLVWRDITPYNLPHPE